MKHNNIMRGVIIVLAVIVLFICVLLVVPEA